MPADKNKTRVLLIKTGALGDVVRTTSVLSGLAARYGEGLELEWLTAPEARPLLDGLVGPSGPIARMWTVLPDAFDELGDELVARGFDRVLSFDDERALCAVATRVAGGPDAVEARVLGAYLDATGERRYTDSAKEWFDMGLLSVHGKAEADRLKIQNRATHPAIFARMLGIAVGEPQLVLPPAVLDAGRARLSGFESAGAQIGLNTGAGGRWPSKALPEERVVQLAVELTRRLDPKPRLVLLGGPEESRRQKRLAAGLEAAGLEFLDSGCDNSLLEFAALVDGLDLIVTSDSLALHLATARRVPTVAFFAPTSAAEIELYGRGLKVTSTAPDACSYAPNADTASLTVERLAAAVEQALPRR